MSDSAAEPDWSLLPHDPVRFFGLSAGFDRRELKRAYNELVRRFKPERFPNEFQRIRAAYEALENAVRYGEVMEPGLTASESPLWEAFGGPAGEVRPRTFSSRSSHTPLAIHERVQSENLSDLYRELKERVDKSPYDYYALAVMADVAAPGDRKQFAEWILCGLAAFPGEGGLCRLLHAYFSGPVDKEHRTSLLVQASKALSEQHFYPLTEPLWRELLRSESFADFRKLLEECEANMRGLNIDNRLVFYLQILKPAMWVADADWFAAKYDFIDQNFNRLPSYFDYDVELLSRLRAYSETRKQFVAGGELCRQLDAAMRDYFSAEQVVGDRSILACQALMTQDTGTLGAAFAEYGSQVYAPFFNVWLWVTYDVGQRHIEPPKQKLDEGVWHPRCMDLLSQVERQTRRSRLGWRWKWRQALKYVAQVAAFLAVVQVTGFVLMLLVLLVDQAGNRKNTDVIVGIGSIVGILIGIAAAFYVSRFIGRKWQGFNFKASNHCYREIWQPAILAFLGRSHLSYDTFRGFVFGTRRNSTVIQWIKYYVDLDFALPMFVLANHFVV